MSPHEVNTPEQPKTKAKRSPPAPVASPPHPVEQAGSYAEAIRRWDFSRAATLIDALSETEQKRAEVRYARATVALRLGDVETALRKVEGLGEVAPYFEREANQIRREAARASLDVTLLSHFLERSTDPEDWLLLAEAHANSSSMLEARKLAQRALAKFDQGKESRPSEVTRAHSILARSYEAEKNKQAAAREYRFLAVNAAGEEQGRDYVADLERVDPKASLSADERMKRAKDFSEQGWVEPTQNELAQIVGRAHEKTVTLAWAVYRSRSDYKLAAKLFQDAANQNPKDRQEHLYYEAKSLARSHHDQEAIQKYELVAQMSGPYTDHASYQAARLRFIDGKWQEAAHGLTAYLTRFGGSAKHTGQAVYDLAIANLAAQNWDVSAKQLTKLIDKESNTRKRARLMQLRAVAWIGAGQKDRGLAALREVIEYRPLSFAALLAAARLREHAQAVPPLILPAPIQTTQAPELLKLELPQKARLLSAVGLDAEAERALRETESELKSQFPHRYGQLLCDLYGKLESAQRRYQIAQYAASWSNLEFAPNQNTRWQWDCIYPRPYEQIVAQESLTRHVPEAFVYAVMRQESSFRPTVVSPAQAVGLMQIIPPTATRIAEETAETYVAEEMRAPAVNIHFAAYYLRRLLDIFDGRFALTAASYNAGPHAVGRWLRSGKDLPLDIFVAQIPYQETREYVYRVLSNYARYTFLDPDAELTLPDLSLPQDIEVGDDAY